jgi:threonine/homoserine/homoserine lactone efflux protein
MFLIQLFFVGLFFSFVGSIPPGTINVSVLQLSIAGHFRASLRFALSATIVEFFYALIAIQFQFAITSSQVIQDNFHIISASVMLALGVINLWPAKKGAGEKRQRFQTSGFRKGLLISLLNPLAIPYWIGITAFLEHQEWIRLDSSNMYVYVSGISTGTFLLLLTLALLAKFVAPFVQNSAIIKKLPGFIFLTLGIYSMVQFILK